MVLKSVLDADVKDKKVLIRVDINSPVSNGKILDNPRFKECSRTISFLIKKKAKIVIIAHQGRKGDSDFIPLKQHADILRKYIRKNVEYVNSFSEKNAIKKIKNMRSGEVILLRNARDYNWELNPEKSKNKLKSFLNNFDIFVNEAFSVSHRNQASITVPPEFLPSFLGLSFKSELEALENFSLGGKTLYLIGGSKIQDYLPIFGNLKDKESKVLVSGVLANLFLVAKGIYLGYENTWLKEKGYFKIIPELKEIYKKYKSQIIFPVDFALELNKSREEIDISELPTDKKLFDVGRNTVELFKSHIKSANKIFMKGPLGFSELKTWSYGTVEILKEISLQSEKGKFSILGGGHLTTSIKKYGIKNSFSHISTSGGALIAFLSGQKLPGIEAIKRSSF